ncbi:MAG: hypothetical protein HDQ94_00445 [Desulfovibrio sp.]|nr:hypothetical protein [Desulfovibrio sp.]
MEERTLELACAALDEFFRQRPHGEAGPAVEAFLLHMRPAPGEAPFAGGASQAGAEAGAPPPGGAEPGERLRAVEEERDLLRARLAECEEALREAESANRKLSATLESALSERADALAMAREAREKLAPLEKSRLRQQDELAALQQFLGGIPEQVRELAAPYVVTDDLVTFLIQSGKFSTLNQLWQACGAAVADGRPEAGMASLLERLLALYNRTAGQNPATLIAPEPGDAYRSAIHQRVRSDGTKVRRLLLPGLRNPGGKMQQPALVELE